MEVCPECDGAGFLVLVGTNGEHEYRETFLCSLCHGSGTVSPNQQVSESTREEVELSPES